MREITPNWIALIAAVVVKQIIGAAWYSPIAFGPAWTKLVGDTPEAMRARLPKVIPLEIVSALVMAFVLVHAVRYAGANSATLGAVVGFMNWLGFVAVSQLNGVLYGRRPLAMFAIEAGYWLVALVVMGAILGGWR